jgi:cytoskeleton-associated protein 5
LRLLFEQGSKAGKASWKIRKEALEEVDAALKQCSGLLDATETRLKFLVDITRALRDRLADTQINLKPVAARVIGSLLSVVDKATQAKLGRIVYAPLINASMNDIKKPMRDASLEALRSGIMASSLVGGGMNDEALEALVAALVSEVTGTTSRVRLPSRLVPFVRIITNTRCFFNSLLL